MYRNTTETLDFPQHFIMNYKVHLVHGFQHMRAHTHTQKWHSHKHTTNEGSPVTFMTNTVYTKSRIRHLVYTLSKYLFVYIYINKYS